ncbi:UBP-type zinc finger domain-containing protein [Chitinophaga rhizophila]|uniref:UBP-type zinc finger domain-containing protein n=1 Tax=Chitinophaga rhizophila TaxID=2866212 RepID=A0ABS7G8T6_9BACT|nr:UBP-type zinc finger domain-containing protein [Chitinophaga rhizophila]MBW8682933.1 UBP-type zinc finger domain-containing protein [Chitinophaga rhizophila]
MEDQSVCQHLLAVKEVQLSEDHVCEECIKTGSDWVHLRTCQTCGVTLCCDQSPHKHMTRHYRATAHPVIASAEEGERWLWCYPDEQFAGY